MNMRALVNTGPGRLELRVVPCPEPGPGQVLIRTAACGICATDLEMIAGWKRTGFPSIPGHEWSGVVEAVGPGVPIDLTGKPCVGNNILDDGREVGFECPGGYGEYLVTQARNLQVLPSGFPLEQAALIEPLAVCLHGLKRLGPAPYASVLIFGDGPIGLLLVMLGTRYGTRKIALVGGRDKRLELARELGAKLAFNYHRLGTGLATGMRRMVGAEYPFIMESSGNARALAAGLKLAAKGGHVLVLGDYGQARAGFAWNMLLHREVTLVGSNTGSGAWPEAARLAAEGRLPLEKLITHRVAIKDYETGLSYMRDRQSGCVKVILNWAIKINGVM
jgi:L-iditol 2-dehydrogenase